MIIILIYLKKRLVKTNLFVFKNKDCHNKQSGKKNKKGLASVILAPIRLK